MAVEYSRIRYLANQINGNVADALTHADFSMFQQDEGYVNYLANYALERGAIKSRHLDSLGKILGINRPYSISAGSDDSFLYGALGYDYPEAWRATHAFGDLSGAFGGLLGSNAETSSSGTVSDGTYIQYIKDIAKLRKTYSIADICTVIEDLLIPILGVADVSQYYYIEFVEHNDIRITVDSMFARYNDYLQTAFNVTFTASPHVAVVTGTIGA